MGTVPRDTVLRVMRFAAIVLTSAVLWACGSRDPSTPEDGLRRAACKAPESRPRVDLAELSKHCSTDLYCAYAVQAVAEVTDIFTCPGDPHQRSHYVLRALAESDVQGTFLAHVEVLPDDDTSVKYFASKRKGDIIRALLNAHPILKVADKTLWDPTMDYPLTNPLFGAK